MKKPLIYLFVFMVLLFCGCNNDIDGVPKSIDTKDVYDIKTPYCNLCIPKSFDDKVEYAVKSENPYTVTFKTVDGNNLFEISFNGTGASLGTLVLEDEIVTVNIKTESLDRENDKYIEHCQYQEEGINAILQNLSAEYDFRVGEEIGVENIETFDINTDVMPLKYPVKWKEDVEITVEENVVKFSCEDIKLFDLCFDMDEGYLLGTYDGKSISIVDYELNEDAFDEDEYLKLSSMKEDVNIIIQNLSENEKFKLAE